MNNYTKQSQPSITLNELEFFNSLATSCGARENWHWENMTTNEIKTEREWLEYFIENPPARNQKPIDEAITALGTDETNAYQITEELNIITGGAANTGVILPAAEIGLEVKIINTTSTAKKVYAATGDAIDDKTATTGFVILQPEEVVTFSAYTTGAWQSDFEADGVYSTMFTDTISENTTDAGVTVDGVKLKDGGVYSTTMIAAFYPQSGIDALSGAGVVSNSRFLTKFTSTGGAQAITLDVGTIIGQMKKVIHVVDGGSGVLTATFVGGTTITFTTVGEYALLQWNGTAWLVLELGNTATPGTLPALA